MTDKPNLTAEQRKTLTRWRLVLGEAGDQHGISIGEGDEQAARIEALVGFLFEPGSDAKPKPGDRTGGQGLGRAMNVPRWVDEVGELFPRKPKW